MRRRKQCWVTLTRTQNRRPKSTGGRTEQEVPNDRWQERRKVNRTRLEVGGMRNRTEGRPEGKGIQEVAQRRNHSRTAELTDNKTGGRKEELSHTIQER